MPSTLHAPCCAALFVVAAAACAPKVAPVDTQIRRIRFEDNGPWLSSRSDAALRGAMAHEQPRGAWPFRSLATLDRNVLEQDRSRVAVHYAHQGWFDAEVIEWEERVKREATEKRPAQVVIVGRVRTGEPTELTDVTVSGTEALSAPARALVEKKLRRLEGDRAELEAYQDAMDEVSRRLGNLAFAHAEVDGELVVDRSAHQASARFDVSPGAVSRFGDVRIDGGDAVPSRLLQQRIRVEQGDAFSFSALDATRNRLYGLGVFATARVEPVLDQGSDVPVDIVLSRREPRHVTAGAGIEAAGGRQEALARAEVGHINIAERMVEARLGATGGYALLAEGFADLQSGLDSIRGGPVLDAEAALSVPVRGGWTSELQVEYVRDITEAFVADKPSGGVSLSGQLVPSLSLALSYRVRYTRYRDVQVDPRQLALLEGAPDLVDGAYLDAHLEQVLIWDRRNDALSPTRGFRHQLTLREAGRFLGGDYDYAGAELDLRGYHPLGISIGAHDLVGAARLGGGYLVPFGEERGSVPVAERLYLGGSGSVRGWIYQHLGPYICSLESDVDCASTPGYAAPEGIDTVPVGGQVSSHGSAELRTDGETFGTSLFTDVGMVWATPEQVGKVPLLASVGIGGRVDTPVGPLRADVAVRTDSLPMFQQEPRAWLHIGLGEAF